MSNKNEMLGFRLLLYLMKLNWAGHTPRQWNECVKHTLVLDRSSYELNLTDGSLEHYLGTRVCAQFEQQFPGKRQENSEPWTHEPIQRQEARPDGNQSRVHIY